MQIHEGDKEGDEEETSERESDNLTGLRTERKEGLSPAWLPPSILKDRPRVVGELPGGGEVKSERQDASQNVKARV